MTLYEIAPVDDEAYCADFDLSSSDLDSCLLDLSKRHKEGFVITDLVCGSTYIFTVKKLVWLAYTAYRRQDQKHRFHYCLNDIHKTSSATRKEVVDAFEATFGKTFELE